MTVTTHREIAEQNLILLATVGSKAHGLALPNTDDHDEMGVCIEPPEFVVGLRLFEQDAFATGPSDHRRLRKETCMARKTIVVSDISGERVDDFVQVILDYPNGRRITLDADTKEVKAMATKGRVSMRPGRKPSRDRSRR